MSDYIPDDLLAIVLLKLPIDSLLRSRCVSKSWRDLIDNPDFVKLHSRTSNRPNSDDLKIVALSDEKFCVLKFDPTDISVASAKQLNYPLNYPQSEIRFVGSCNGLLCLSTDNDIVFWNPWTQKYWEVPSPPIEDSVGGQISFRLGFGYEHVEDDYKVVSFIRSWEGFEESGSYQDEVYVYSLKLNSWKRIGNFPYKFPEYESDVGALADGSLHWIVKRSEWDVGNSIMAFDLRSEEIRLMPCPRNPNTAFQQNLKILNGCLSLLSYYYSSGRYRVDLSVMEDYGGDKSWTKLTSIKMPYGIWSIWRLTPLIYSKNSRQVLLQIEREKLVVYDLETKSIVHVIIHGAASSFASCVCFGSLVQPCASETDRMSRSNR